MDRKIYINVKAKMILRANEGVDLREIMDNLSLQGISDTSNFDIEDTTIENVEATDSK